MVLPKIGVKRDQVRADLEALRSDDLDWRTGRIHSMVYDVGEAVQELARDAAFE